MCSEEQLQTRGCSRSARTKVQRRSLRVRNAEQRLLKLSKAVGCKISKPSYTFLYSKCCIFLSSPGIYPHTLHWSRDLESPSPEHRDRSLGKHFRWLHPCWTCRAPTSRHTPGQAKSYFSLSLARSHSRAIINLQPHWRAARPWPPRQTCEGHTLSTRKAQASNVRSRLHETRCYFEFFFI
jgi:hypothetical protein